MNRRRRVADLYESVRSIRESYAFQRVIGQELDDKVLADLRTRFWDGRGDMPWQVEEINRLLTGRRELRAAWVSESAASHGKASPAAPKRLKDRIESNIVVFCLGTLLIGFLAGIGTYQGALRLMDYGVVPHEWLRVTKDEGAKRSQEVAVLVTTSRQAEAKAGKQRWLRIKGIEGLDGVRARLVARVNGRAYSYPSRAMWSMLGPRMPAEDFALPIDAETFDISFELLTLTEDNQLKQLHGQETQSVTSWPYEGEYRIKAVTPERAGSVRRVAAPAAVRPLRGSPRAAGRAPARVAFEIR